MRQRSNAWWCLAALGLVVALGHGSVALAADATGTWKWTVERGGNTIEQTLKLKQDKDQLTGTISGRAGTETPIEDGKVSDDTVSFKVTREFNGNKIVIKYEGKVTGDMIKGESKFEREGEDTQTRPWEAKRAE
jgi:hypothetical protein